MKKPMSSARHKDDPGSVTLSVRIQPRASRNSISTTESGGLKIRLTAPPVDGAANEALVKLLSDTLSIPKSRIEIISGHTSRDKILRISGISNDEVKRLLNSRGE